MSDESSTTPKADTDKPKEAAQEAGVQKEKVKRGVNKVVLVTALVLVALAVGGVAGVFWFIENERARDHQAWQVRLGIVADSRTAAVTEWVDTQYGVLREMSENASLQLYMTELMLSDGDRSEITDEPAQASYLRNLLVASADRAGFSAPTSAGEVSANVEKAGVAGLALTDADGEALVATPAMPPITGRLRAAVAAMSEGDPGFVDIYIGLTGLPTMAFITPVYAVQGGSGGSDFIGLIIGVRIVGDDLFEKLEQPGEIEQTAETYLVRANKPNVEYVSPLKDGTKPLKRRLAQNTPDLAAAFVLETAGGFGIMRDYDGEQVLVTGRPLTAVPWTLVRKVTTAEALADTDTRLTTMLVVFLMLIGGMAVTLIAVWRHGTSIRAAEAAEGFRISAERFGNLSKFLKVVTDGQPTSIMAVTDAGIITFANYQASVGTGITHEEMLGKSMSSVIGPIKGKYFLDLNAEIIRNREEVLAGTGRVSNEKTFEDERGRHIIRSYHIPLRPDRDYPPGCLMILDDISELVEQRERRSLIMNQLVSTLLTVVGRRDPFTADHALRVSDVAECIAKEMELEDQAVQTSGISGKLMNLGKTLVPVEILSKEGALTDEEMQIVRDSVQVSADLLQEVDFDGPVVDTIRQVQEKWDGSGPRGMSGEDLEVSACIVAVANAFVGMASARPYRAGMEFDKASGILIGLGGKEFSRKPVAALVNYIENRGGRDRWAHFSIPPKA
ncbi:MAG: PAS domain S-box protein [Alphaproteobacteria bacterium]|nr:PAS domain S-box protein [Alphaproteobacteria bacterium]